AAVAGEVGAQGKGVGDMDGALRQFAVDARLNAAVCLLGFAVEQDVVEDFQVGAVGVDIGIVQRRLLGVKGDDADRMRAGTPRLGSAGVLPKRRSVFEVNGKGGLDAGGHACLFQAANRERLLDGQGVARLADEDQFAVELLDQLNGGIEQGVPEAQL